MRGRGIEVACEIPSDVGHIDMMVFLAEKIGEFCGLGEEERVHVGMALREALNNAVVHGNRRDSAKKVRISFLRDAKALRISVRDEGPGFSAGHLPDPRDPMNLLKTTGRGIFCIHTFMDE
jgi:serine/threonine-protein kinase RsbW